MHASGLRSAWLAVCFMLALSPGAMAQDYPTRTIKIIVPTGVGGITDILARLVGKCISDQLGQPVIIDNRSGAGGILGTRAVAQAEPDGYTLLMVSEPCGQSGALRQSALRQRKGFRADFHGDEGQ
jgi:tripartite-type tricarboxylate transporter receptor subunit TctC